jgi:excisionase family DNA binding protein
MPALLEDLLFSPEEVAEQFKVTTTTVYRWLRSGKLGGMKISHKAWRISSRDLEAFAGPSPSPQLAVARPRAMEQEWLQKHEAKYAGHWVALDGAHLVAQGTSARAVLEAARKEGIAQPLVVHVTGESELPFGGW